MANILQQYFPLIRTRKEVLKDIREDRKLLKIYQSWKREQQEEFLDFCTGQRGVRILYDSFFKEIMNPDLAPERLEEFLSLIMQQKVEIHKVLPNGSSRLGDEESLVVMDIIVELEDHSLVDIEIQKIGYRFSGQRSACYSADMLLRQYKRIRSRKKKSGKRDMDCYIRKSRRSTLSFYMKTARKNSIGSRMNISIDSLRDPTRGLKWNFS